MRDSDKAGKGNWVLDIPERTGESLCSLSTQEQKRRGKKLYVTSSMERKFVPGPAEQLNVMSSNNLYGEIIKVLMITASGAEGISLRNVRYVHITEPYWHPVRMQQVIGRASNLQPPRLAK